MDKKAKSDFSPVAGRYQKTSYVQSAAGKKLLALADIGKTDNVLDIGCGAGSMLLAIRKQTGALVTGADPSSGMVRKAKETTAGQAISLFLSTAEELEKENEYDVITCNSAFQWVTDESKAAAAFFKALRPGGRVVIQAPATRNYCPNFIRAVDHAKGDRAVARLFAHFSSPWFFLNTAKEYTALFESARFVVDYAVIKKERNYFSVEKTMSIFESGAAVGYLNPAYYAKPVDDQYKQAFRQKIRESFRRQSDDDGKIDLVFNRIYLRAIKQ